MLNVAADASKKTVVKQTNWLQALRESKQKRRPSAFKQTNSKDQPTTGIDNFFLHTMPAFLCCDCHFAIIQVRYQTYLCHKNMSFSCWNLSFSMAIKPSWSEEYKTKITYLGANKALRALNASRVLNLNWKNTVSLSCPAIHAKHHQMMWIYVQKQLKWSCHVHSSLWTK